MIWYAKVPKFPEFPSVKNGVCEALFFSASVQALGMRLPVNTFGHVLAVTLCACSAQPHSTAFSNIVFCGCLLSVFIVCFVHSMINMMPLITGSRVLIKLVEHHYIAANLVDIKFGYFVQNAILFNLVSF